MTFASLSFLILQLPSGIVGGKGEIPHGEHFVCICRLVNGKNHWLPVIFECEVYILGLGFQVF